MLKKFCIRWLMVKGDFGRNLILCESDLLHFMFLDSAYVYLVLLPYLCPIW